MAAVHNYHLSESDAVHLAFVPDTPSPCLPDKVSDYSASRDMLPLRARRSFLALLDSVTRFCPALNLVSCIEGARIRHSRIRILFQPDNGSPRPSAHDSIYSLRIGQRNNCGGFSGVGFRGVSGRG
jgi:hypothetical protein